MVAINGRTTPPPTALVLPVLCTQRRRARRRGVRHSTTCAPRALQSAARSAPVLLRLENIAGKLGAGVGAGLLVPLRSFPKRGLSEKEAGIRCSFDNFYLFLSIAFEGCGGFNIIFSCNDVLIMSYKVDVNEHWWVSQCGSDHSTSLRRGTRTSLTF